MSMRQDGFTIVEIMMYLLIAGVLFAVSLTTLSGRQRSNQFNQSVREFESVINDLSNDVSTGVYPFIEGVECTVSAGTITFSNKAGAQPGDNNQCVYVGKVVQLLSSDVPGDDSDYYAHTLVGKIVSGPSDFAGSKPVVLNRAGAATVIGPTTPRSTLPWGTKITRAYYIDGGVPIDVRGLAYVYRSFGNNVTSGGTKSGSAEVALYAVIGLGEISVSSFADEIDFETSVSPGSMYKELKGSTLTICLEGGGASKRAMLELGGAGSELSARTNYQISAECP